MYWVLPVWLLIFAIHRLYDPHLLFRGFQEYSRAVNACTLGMAVVVFFSFVDERLIISRGWLILVWALAVVMVVTARFVLRRAVRRLRARGFLATSMLIVGANEEAVAMAEQFVG